jgi:hypothetical protein
MLADKIHVVAPDFPGYAQRLHFLDTGHFALEEKVERIGSLMHEFLDRTINKKMRNRSETGACGLSMRPESAEPRPPPGVTTDVTALPLDS